MTLRPRGPLSQGRKEGSDFVEKHPSNECSDLLGVPECRSTYPRRAFATACLTWAGQLPTAALLDGERSLPWAWRRRSSCSRCPGTWQEKGSSVFLAACVWTLRAPGSKRDVQNKSPSHRVFARGSEFNIWTSNGRILASAGQALHVDKALDLINQGVTNWPFQCARKQGEWQHRSQLDQMPPTPGSDANHSLKNQFLALPPEIWQNALPI